MVEAVAEYDRHRQAPDEWALGRFVVPLSRWSEFATAVGDLKQHAGPWPVSLLAASNEVAAVARLVQGPNPLFHVEAVESRMASIDEVAATTGLMGLGVDVFVEPSGGVNIEQLATELARIGGSAKIRTGGVTVDAFPTPREVLAFIRACRRAGIRFKATAGLHHAIRGEYRLTYDPAPPTGVMFGFVNIAIAAALLWFGRGDEVILAALEEQSADAFDFSDAGLSWRDERLTIEQLDEVRSAFFVGFGSCSFREPMAEIGLEAVPRS